ncbi:MAG: Gfo/Idh/MocA family protein [Acutalibacteraceae bacterium]|jgi:predicted dehydrogenase
MQKLRTGVIGIGNMGSAHASCIAGGQIDGLELTAVCDIKKEKLNAFKEMHGDIKTYTDYNLLIASGEVDAVVIAVPHPLHSKIAIKALECGLHVMLEKPVDISVSNAQRLNEVAQKTDRVFAIMFNQRTNPLFIKAKEIMDSGALGALKRTVWIVTNWYRTQNYYDSGEWRATWSGEGGGVLLNQAPHNLDLWQWICGMPESVVAFCDIAKYHNIEVEDDVTIITRYKNGAVGTFITSTGEYPGTNRLEISGDLGKIVLEDGILKWWRLKQPEPEVRITSKKNFQKIEYDYWELKQLEPEPAHKGMLQNFANAILKGEKLIAPGTDGIFELTISNAAYISNFNGHKEVKIPFNTDEFDELLAKLAANSSGSKTSGNSQLSGEYSQRWQVNW